MRQAAAKAVAGGHTSLAADLVALLADDNAEVRDTTRQGARQGDGGQDFGLAWPRTLPRPERRGSGATRRWIERQGGRR